MTAHPKSVVGRLRAKVDAYDVECSRPAPQRAQDRFNAQTALEWESCDAAPALLAALEKVWAELPDPAKTSTRDVDHRLEDIRTILAPLFLAPETPSHD